MNDITVSIDGQLHIRKLCQRYLPEKELALLEWIRFARLRKAKTISLALTPDQTVIIDDGQPITPSMWQSIQALIRSTDSQEIERSIEKLKPLRGIGILAPLASGSNSFAIVSTAAEGRQTLAHGCQVVEKTLQRIGKLVGLILGPRPVDPERERDILRYHLPMVNAQITLDNQTLAHCPQSRDSFLSLKLYQGDAIVGTVALPKSGNHSSLELCHGDIPWRYLHFPAQQGRIFWARLESVLDEGELGSILQQIEQSNIRLLEYLRDNPDNWHPSLRGRIEELLFEWSRPLAPQYPILQLPLFRISGEKNPVSLARILETSQQNSLTAAITDSGKHGESYGTGTLLLTRKQADFLSRTVQIPLNFSGSPQTDRIPLLPFSSRCLQSLLQSLDRCWASWFAKTIPPRQYSESEKQLENRLASSPVWKNLIKESAYQMILLDHHGIWPSHLNKRKRTITVHARHLISRALLHAISDNKPGALFEKALVPPESIG